MLTSLVRNTLCLRGVIIDTFDEIFVFFILSRGSIIEASTGSSPDASWPFPLTTWCIWHKTSISCWRRNWASKGTLFAFMLKNPTNTVHRDFSSPNVCPLWGIGHLVVSPTSCRHWWGCSNNRSWYRVWSNLLAYVCRYYIGRGNDDSGEAHDQHHQQVNHEHRT